MPKIVENFFENNIFTYQSYSCNSVSDTIHINPNMPASIIYKVMSNANKEVQFAYAAKKGLVRLNKNGTIAENNVLGSFIAIGNQKKSDYTSFFTDNGFLFPISDTEYEEISPGQLNAISERLRNTVELMSGVSSIHKNYNKLFALLFLLLFSPDAEVKTSRMDYTYKTCHHKLLDLLTDTSTVPQRIEMGIIKAGMDSYTVYDSVLDKTVDLDSQEYLDCISGYSTTSATMGNLVYLYANYNGDIEIKKSIDLLYHIFHDYGCMPEMTYERGTVFENGEHEFSEEIKNAILDVSKYIIGEEINANLSGIYPLYDTNTMTPSWRVNSLLSALYFSIFYIKPDMELYRQCANPRCGKYFLVKTTSTRTKYCGVECCNRVTQDTYRKNQRAKKEN